MLLTTCWSTALQVPVTQAAGFGGGLVLALAAVVPSAAAVDSVAGGETVVLPAPAWFPVPPEVLPELSATASPAPTAPAAAVNAR
jgi:hypothetical protein